MTEQTKTTAAQAFLGDAAIAEGPGAGLRSVLRLKIGRRRGVAQGRTRRRSRSWRRCVPWRELRVAPRGGPRERSPAHGAGGAVTGVARSDDGIGGALVLPSTRAFRAFAGPADLTTRGHHHGWHTPSWSTRATRCRPCGDVRGCREHQHPRRGHRVAAPGIARGVPIAVIRGWLRSFSGAGLDGEAPTTDGRPLPPSLPRLPLSR